MYYTYMIRCSDNSIYTGMTNNLERRIEEHITKDKRGAKYTKSHNAEKLEIAWKIECVNCGTSRESIGRSYYNIDEFGELKLVPQNYGDKDASSASDKRLEVIEMWKFLKNYFEGFLWGSDIGLKLLVLLLVIIAISGSCGK